MTNNTFITEYGLCGLTEACSIENPSMCLGRVLSQEKGAYRLIGESGERTAEVSGRLRHDASSVAEYPVVGDYVLFDANESGNAIIKKVLQRKSVFIRRAAGTARVEQAVAANIDYVFLCMSLNNDFNLRRMERYLSIAWDSGASPVVVLTKSDLCEDTEEKRRLVEAIALGADILVTSGMESDGCEQIRKYLNPGVTIALIGSSGVGKSTLINRLLGEELLFTGAVRNDDKGRHTSTRRQLLLLPKGGMVIDTPGMRELGMWDSAEGADRAFADVEGFAVLCRFSDCTHKREPGCAVREAIARGELSAERVRAYEKLKTENAFSASSASYLAAKKEKFKSIAKINKNGKKN